MSEEYNGWVNYETWCANLWLGNDEGKYDMCLEATVHAVDGERPESWDWRVGDALKDMVETYAEEGIRLIGDEMSMHRVDWTEIGRHWADDYREGLGE